MIICNIVLVVFAMAAAADDNNIITRGQDEAYHENNWKNLTKY